FVELERLAAVELPLEKTEREQRRVPFVQMIETFVNVERTPQRRAAHPEHDLLAESVVAVAAVERVGEPAIAFVVFGKLRIEEEDLDFLLGPPCPRVIQR